MAKGDLGGFPQISNPPPPRTLCGNHGSVWHNGYASLVMSFQHIIRTPEGRLTMAFRIEKAGDFIEVHLSGNGDKSEVVDILRKLYEMAPRKEISDLWLVSEEYVVPWDAFLPIVMEVTRFLSNDMITNKTAIVVASHLQMAQGRLYLEEAKRLPFAIGIFMTRQEAIRWLKT